ncbi:MAG: response regulator transcription factor [Candidatus Pelethousia sp.]|nr:response regulator transcription factor [Candidatus Pelethousia sp.]
MIRVLLADDHLLFRSMLEEMLKRDDAIEIVASCADGKEALEGCRTQEPDIALLDIGMPGKGGMDALQEIKERMPQIKVVMLTTFEDDESIKSAAGFGADGYLIKDMKPETLIMSIKCIYDGMAVFHKSAYALLQSALADIPRVKDKKVQIGAMVFDAVDIKILQLIIQGKSNRDIGACLNYSEGTIKNKITKLLSLTGFSDRTELSVFAINHRLV